MGFNSTLMVNNDCLGEIEREKDLGKKIGRALQGVSPGHPVEVCEGLMAVETHHADDFVVTAVGGCKAINLGFAGRRGATELEILKALADRMGYRLTKKKQSCKEQESVCDLIIQRMGKENKILPGFYTAGKTGWEYRTATFEVFKSKSDRAFEVYRIGPTGSKNPVLQRNGKGVMIRTHGELRLVAEDVAKEMARTYGDT